MFPFVMPNYAEYEVLSMTKVASLESTVEERMGLHDGRTTRPYSKLSESSGTTYMGSCPRQACEEVQLFVPGVFGRPYHSGKPGPVITGFIVHAKDGGTDMDRDTSLTSHVRSPRIRSRPPLPKTWRDFSSC